MRLGELMTKEVKTCQAGELAADAQEQMRRHHVHHLIVVDGKQLLGVLSARDLHGRLSRDASVSDLMIAPVVTARPETTVREAANLMRGRSIGCLPIVQDAKLVGIVTVTDLLELLGKGTTMPFPRTKPARQSVPPPRVKARA